MNFVVRSPARELTEGCRPLLPSLIPLFCRGLPARQPVSRYPSCNSQPPSPW
jgi:hypothetical protein